MLADISAPPPPPVNVLIGAGAGCILLGAALLLWGRQVSKAVMGLALAAAGAACAPLIVERISYDNTPVVAVIAAAVAGAIGFFLGRFLWAVVLGAGLGSTALTAFGCLNAAGMEPPVWPATTNHADQFSAVTGWLTGTGKYLTDWLSRLWEYNPLAVVLAGGGPAAIGIALGFFYPQAVLVFVTGALGGLLLVAGTGLCVWAAKPEWAAQWIAQWHIPLAAAGALALVGWVVQTRVLLIQRKKKPQKEPPGDGKPKDSKADKK
jgi:hypothetical protein